MNDVAAFIWEKLQNPISEADLVEAILEIYDVDEQRATEDVKKALSRLDSMGVIEREDS